MILKPKIMPEYIDIHSHVHFAAYDTDRVEVIKRALDAGVWMINVGTNKATSESSVLLAEKYDRGVYSIIGIHPIHSVPSFHDKNELGEKKEEDKGETFDYDFYKKLGAHPKVLGIGEVGLDYFRVEGEENFKKQCENFIAQVELAVELKKPIMLHIRNGKEKKTAYKDVISILKPYIKSNKSLKGDVHFFAGTKEESKEFFDLGFSISFTGVITFTSDYNEVIKNAPLDRLMTETDCPYVSPVPFRGKRNEPMHVKEVVKKIAEIRGEDFDRVRTTLAQNAVNFFL